MSQQKKPYHHYEFTGLDLSGNPLKRPFGTASSAHDVRIMNGNWIRLKGGRKARVNLTNGVSAAHFINANIRSSYGNDYALLHASYSGSKKMLRVDLSNWTVDETGLETISETWDSTLVAHSVLADSVVWDNGRGGSVAGLVPTPSLTQWQPASTIRYFGLDCEKNGSVTVSFSSGGSGINSVTSSVKIYVGLHNTATQHYSNGILIGTLTASGGTGEISVTGLTNISYPTHGASETSELQWVFYATIDGYSVPYLILNSTLNGPFAVAATSNTADLDILSGTINGWVLDTTKEMPISNYAPRRMRSIAYANGRIYGILSNTTTGSFTGVGVRYEIAANELYQVVWSDAAGSVKNRDYLGDPLQSWPSFNASNVPSGERPLVVFPAPNMVEVLVFTATKTFILREQADGVHDWDTISNEHGLDPYGWYKLVCRTRHGIVWLTQNKQLAIYTNEGEFKILSAQYDAAIQQTAYSYNSINYIYDPVNLIDQIQLYATGAFSVLHDFNTGASTASEPHTIYASGVLLRQNSGLAQKHFVVAASTAGGSGVGIYTLYGQADESNRERTYDQLFTGASGSTTATQELPTGLYRCNWSFFEDLNLRKEIPFVDIVGDAKAYSQTPSGSIVLNWKTALDFASVGTQAIPVKVTNEVSTEPGDLYYRFKVSQPHHWVWMFSLYFYSHSNELTHYPLPGLELLNNTNNLYGSVAAMMLHIGSGSNRL